MIFSLHNHTTWSDGENSISQMLAAALELGIDKLGISDHYVPRPVGEEVVWSMPLIALKHYVIAVREAAENAPNGTLLLGLEADYAPESIDLLAETLQQYPFDYLIGAVHFIGDFPIDESPLDWAALSEDECNDMARRYWQTLRAMAESRVFDIVAHLDLYKKFGWHPSIDLSLEIADTLDAIAAAGMALEINCAGWNKPVQEAYPSEELLREACKREIPLVINADAHRAADIANHFPRARALARAAGYRSLCGYRQREHFAVGL